MSFRVQGSQQRYKIEGEKISRIVRTKSYNGINIKLVEISNPELFPEGWAIVKGDSHAHGIYHFYEKNIQHSLCDLAISDIPKKRIYVDPDKYVSEKYKPCSYCVRRLTHWKNTGIHPNERKKEPSVLPRKRKSKSKSFVLKPHKEKYIITKCPKCKTNVFFWNIKNKNEHLCTVCKKIVDLSKEIISRGNSIWN